MSIQSRYKREKPLAVRREESETILRKFADHVPVIVDKDPSSNVADIERPKFLVSADLTVSHFVYVVRKRIALEEHQAIFLFVNKKIPEPHVTMGRLYEENKDEDGFLYITYSADTAYGH